MTKKISLYYKIFTLILLVISLTSCGNNNTTNNTNTKTNTITSENKAIAIINTNIGTIEVELDLINAPNTSKNFIDLVNKKFYDGLIFHRVIPGFVAQGGDPNGDGTGGSNKTIELEIKCEDGTMIIGKIADCVPLLKHEEGVIAMARAMDPNSASSQFYITLAPQPALDGQYAVFGKVISGMDIVKQIKVGDVITSIKMK